MCQVKNWEFVYLEKGVCDIRWQPADSAIETKGYIDTYWVNIKEKVNINFRKNMILYM